MSKYQDVWVLSISDGSIHGITKMGWGAGWHRISAISWNFLSNNMIEAPHIMFPLLRRKPLFLASTAPHHINCYHEKSQLSLYLEGFSEISVTPFPASFLLCPLCVQRHPALSSSALVNSVPIQPCRLDLADTPAFTIGYMYQNLFRFSMYFFWGWPI